ncbi:NUDIX domain-containing protein [Pseudonocardia humida]|uniref:NUDIX domain-containing protein n=1 Tax=Pseudonocardia humida TaxID=2800819 RepID=A0ABT1AAW4_9PSEU|nr:NUDIX domain-containing protein [Pseudonocardia humida]MCO1660172.1 NUDIX domain-containing protein [Pseudonocardia humida]
MTFWVVPAAYVLLLRRPPDGSDGPDEVLLQLRHGTGYRDGHWAAGAAGHVEQGETVLAAACREAEEELGVTVTPDALTPVTVMHRTQSNHSPIDERVDFFFTVREWTGRAVGRERDKIAGLRWYALDDLPEPVVPHEKVVLDGLLSGALPPVVVHGFDGT